MAAITAEKTGATRKVAFHGLYVIIPAFVLLAVIVMAAVLYPHLPAQVAYHFNGDTPDRWISRTALTATIIVLQVVLALLGLALVFLAVVSSRQMEESPLLKKVLFVMGNIVAIPQLILGFATADISLYNAYQIRLFPVWIFALIVMVLGAALLAVFFLQARRQTRQPSGKNPQE